MSGFQSLSDSLAAPHVARPHGSAKTVFGSVGKLDRFRFGLEGLHAQHGSKDLFPHDRHLGGDPIEDRRRYVAAALFLNRSLQYRFGAGFEPLLDIALHAVALSGARERA